MTTTIATFAGSAAQENFVRGMLLEIWGQDAAQADAAWNTSVAAGRMSTRQGVREGIDFLIGVRDAHRAARKAAGAGAAAAVIADHELVHGDCMTGTFGVARVVKAQAGHLYATRLVGEGAAADYEYWAGGLAIMGRDAELRKLTLDEAIAISAARSKCVRCNRKLKLGVSIKAGMGRVCASYFA